MANMDVQLQRMNAMTSWGFRLQGGTDFREELSVKKVNPNTPAQMHGLQAGDAILSINGYQTAQLTHSQASAMIKNAGAVLDLTLGKGQCRSIRPSGPMKFKPAPTTQHTVNMYGPYR